MYEDTIYQWRVEGARLGIVYADLEIARAMPQGDIIGLAPPMCLTRAEADIVIAATKGALDDFNPV